MTAGPRIAVVDYGMGNRRSVEKALEHVGASAQITNDPADLEAADGVVLPGVGAFPLAIRNLTELGLVGLLREVADDGKPLLGVCLGMQLLFERSDELERTAGLSLIAGNVTPLSTGGLRIPHIGWNDVEFVRDSPLTAGFGPGCSAFYHVHSLAARPSDGGDLVGTTTYGETFATIVGRGNVLGVQFHPEKSSAHGLRMLENFVSLCRPRVAAAAPV